MATISQVRGSANVFFRITTNSPKTYASLGTECYCVSCLSELHIPLISRGPSSAETPESMEFLLPSLRWHFRHGEWDLRVCPGSPGEGRFIWLDRCMLSRNKTSSMGSGHLHSNLECLRIACLLSHKEARSLKHQGVQISIGGNRICSRHFQLTYLTRWKSRAGNTQLSGYIIWHLFACVFEALVSDLWRPCGPCTFWILFHLRHGFLPLLWKLEVKWIHRFCSAFF